MALSMAQPWRHTKSNILHLRQRTPRDLVARLKGTTVVLPLGDGVAAVKVGDTVQLSLKTTDAKKAKELHAVADAALRRFWEGHRSGPKRLTYKEAAALAGTLYADFARIEDDPGSPELWIKAAEGNMAARLGEATLIIGDPALAASVARRDRFGPFADLLLAREGLVVDADSRELLLKAVQGAMEDVTARLRKAADFDYTPDPAAQRFPVWEAPRTAAKVPVDKLTVDELFSAWAAFQADKLAPNTVKRYRASLMSLATFTRGRDVNGLSGDDLHGWAEHRRDVDGINPRSVNKNDLVAASSVFKWAMSREGGKRMALNPATGVSLTEGASKLTREKTFRAEEITAILKAAISAPPEPKNPTSGSAKRWCPWLAAYSGARISELTGLLGSDVRREGGVPVMHFRKTKTGLPRTVPLHEHLIEQGFMEFAASRGSLPLFYDPARATGKATTDPAEIRSRKVAQWVRDTVKLDAEVAPDHGWRHTWKTTALGVGIPQRISDAITGHGTKAVARGYETPPVKMMADAMAKFPRYEVD